MTAFLHEYSCSWTTSPHLSQSLLLPLSRVCSLMLAWDPQSLALHSVTRKVCCRPFLTQDDSSRQPLPSEFPTRRSRSWAVPGPLRQGLLSGPRLRDSASGWSLTQSHPTPSAPCSAVLQPFLPRSTTCARDLRFHLFLLFLSADGAGVSQAALTYSHAYLVIRPLHPLFFLTFLMKFLLDC